MNAKESDISRRQAFVLGTRLLIAPAVVAWAIAPGHARAAKASKTDFLYQDKPKDGKSCATCRLFEATESDKGTCAVIEGEVSPRGWCIAYLPRA